MSPDWLKVKSLDVGVECKQIHATITCSVDHQKCLVDCLVKKTHIGTHVMRMLRWSHDQRNTLYKVHALPFYFICVSTTMQVPSKEEERHCKYTQRWCLGLLHDHKVKYLSKSKSISVAIGK